MRLCHSPFDISTNQVKAVVRPYISVFFFTLSHVFSPSQFFTSFNPSFNLSLIPTIMMSLDQELQQYLYTIAAARQEPCSGSENLDIFLDRHLGQEDTSPPLNILPVSFSYMKDIVGAMEFFTEFCVLLFAKGHGAPYTPPLGISNLLYGRPKEEQRKLLETCLPLSMWDKHRIRRALLRFQLYCELFHQPGESSASDNDDD